MLLVSIMGCTVTCVWCNRLQIKYTLKNDGCKKEALSLLKV